MDIEYRRKKPGLVGRYYGGGLFYKKIRPVADLGTSGDPCDDLFLFRCILYRITGRGSFFPVRYPAGLVGENSQRPLPARKAKNGDMTPLSR